MQSAPITESEIQGLIAFGLELSRRRKASSLKFKQISEATAVDGRKAITVGYLSEICAVAEGRSDKRFRITPDKVIRIANALGWDKNEALNLARLASDDASSLSAPVAQAIKVLANAAGRLPEEASLYIIDKATNDVLFYERSQGKQFAPPEDESIYQDEPTPE